MGSKFATVLVLVFTLWAGLYLAPIAINFVRTEQGQ